MVSGEWYKVKLKLTGEEMVMIWSDGAFFTSRNGTKFSKDDVTSWQLMTPYLDRFRD